MNKTVGRRNCIPIIYTQGTHYEVGFDVGRTFKSLIQEYVKNSEALNDELIPLYETDEGKKIYDCTLKCIQKNFPQYVKELEGTADGCEVPFYKLFLMHIDQQMTMIKNDVKKNVNSNGCSTVCCNQSGQEILGHTEDAFADSLGNFYFVSAHIKSNEPEGKWKIKEEQFISLCYAGHLPGFTMNYNYHGLIYSINVLQARNLCPAKISDYFLCRALLSAKDISEVENILRDKGCGSGVGFSVNATFLNESEDRIFYNFEVGPSSITSDESIVNKLVIKHKEHSFHCNKYLRLKVPELGGLIIKSSDNRQKVFDELKPPKTRKDVIHLLSHQSHDNFTLFRDYEHNDPNTVEPIATIAVGVFDCLERTWTIWANNPERYEPIVILPLNTFNNPK